jgi:serine/threonine protein kinase
MEFWEINKKSYQYVSRIGKGGFSEVFHCICSENSKNCAVKKVVITSQENFNLMLNEINLLKRLQNTKKVVQLYD